MKPFLLSPRKTAICLLAAVFVLATVSVAVHALQYVYGTDRFTLLVRLFNLSGEQNIAAWFSSVMLFACALLLAAIADNERRQGRGRFLKHWWALAVIFLYISLDESAEIHESINQPLRELLQSRGVLYQPWVIPAAGLLAIFLVAYLPFLKHLSRRIRILFVASGAVYVGGALGMELAGNYVQDYYPESIVFRGGLATLEDFLEMSGVVLFIYALQTHASLATQRPVRAS